MWEHILHGETVRLVGTDRAALFQRLAEHSPSEFKGFELNGNLFIFFPVKGAVIKDKGFCDFCLAYREDVVRGQGRIAFVYICPDCAGNIRPCKQYDFRQSSLIRPVIKQPSALSRFWSWLKA
jgi:hypothetical protein